MLVSGQYGRKTKHDWSTSTMKAVLLLLLLVIVLLLLRLGSEL